MNDVKKTERKRFTGIPSVDRPWLDYYDGETRAAPDPDCSLIEYLHRCNENRLNDTALNYFGRKISYRKLFENIDHVAEALQAMGVRKGDIVSICGLNTPETVYLFYAVNKIGAVSNWLGLTSPVQDLHEQMASTRSRVVFVVEMAVSLIEEAAKGSSVEMIITMPIQFSIPLHLRILMNTRSRGSSGRSVRWERFLSAVSREISADDPHSTEQEGAVGKGAQLAVIEYTGGSTGVPKGVMLSNRNLNAYYVNFKKANDHGHTSYRPGEKFLAVVPFFLAFGLSSGCHGPLSNSMELILGPDPKPDAAARLIRKAKPNHIIAGRLMIDSLKTVLAGKKDHLSYVYSITYGGETSDRNWESTSERTLRQSGLSVPILNAYGMTETSACILFAVQQENRPLMPLGNVDVKIVDPDDHHIEYGYDTEGELCLSSDTIMMGYYQHESETNQVIFEENGRRWIRTHDLASVAKDGTVTITGRIKRIYHKLIPGKAEVRVYPMRIEEVLSGDPAVLASAVVGIKDDQTAYRTIVFLVLQDTEADSLKIKKRLSERCRNGLPESHLPDEYVFVDELPVTRAGKVDYMKLEKIAADRKNSEKPK